MKKPKNEKNEKIKTRKKVKLLFGVLVSFVLKNVNLKLKKISWQKNIIFVGFVTRD